MKNFNQEIKQLIKLFKLGKYNKAELLSKRLINIYPDDAQLYNVLGLSLAQQKKIDEAIDSYNKGIKVNPDLDTLYNNLGNIYKFLEKFDEAKDHYIKAIDKNKNSPEPQNNLGNLYRSLGNFTEAIDCYKKAIAINPRFFQAHYNLAVAYKSTGIFDEAKKFFEQTISLKPYFFTAHRNLSELINYKKDNKHFDLLLKIYNDHKIPREQKKELAFALGKASDDKKDFQKAFTYFNEGNKLHRENINFSIKKEKVMFNDIKKIFNKELFSKYSKSGCVDSKPIFILGMPRSGTTLVEQIISSHPKVFGGDELNFITLAVNKYFVNKDSGKLFDNISNITQEELINVGKEYIDEINKISKNSNKVTDKLPINFKWIGLIKLILPNCKIIHCIRNSRDNCFSIFKNFFTSTELNFAYNINEIIEFYNFYNDLMKHWNKLLPQFVYDIKYENLVQSPKEQISLLLKECNLDWNDDCLKFYNNKRAVKTASDTQVRRKIYSNSIESWKNYEKDLKSAFSKLSS